MNPPTDPPPVRHTSHTRLFVILGISLAAVIAIVVGCSLVFREATPQPHCPEDCQAPPIAPVDRPREPCSRGRRCPPRYPGRPPAAARTTHRAFVRSTNQWA